MPVAADRYGPAAVTASAANAVVVTSGHTYILIDITVANTTASPIDFTMSFGADAAATRLYPAVTIAPHSSLNWTGRRVMKTTEAMQVFGSATGLTITVSYLDVT